MRNFIRITAILVAYFLTGCSSSPSVTSCTLNTDEFHASASIQRINVDNQFTTNVKIQQVNKDGSRTTIASPTIKSVAGQKATISVRPHAHADWGDVTTVSVDIPAAGNTEEAVIEVAIRQNSQLVASPRMHLAVPTGLPETN